MDMAIHTSPVDAMDLRNATECSYGTAGQQQTPLHIPHWLLHISLTLVLRPQQYHVIVDSEDTGRYHAVDSGYGQVSFVY